LTTGNPGTDPVLGGIWVRGGAAGSVVLESSAVEAIRVTQPGWRFSNLDIRGVCADDSTCEHAFHVTGAANGTSIDRCRLIDFNAQIKSNGDTVGPAGERVFPSYVVIEANEIYDTRPRQTANPVTKIDVVGGTGWQIHHNRIHDFEKALGDQVSYGAFLKGGSNRGVMSHNLVVCAQVFSGGTRIGLSLGGGGTSPDAICQAGSCTPEHRDGLLRDNVIAHCSDVGIYLNAANATRIIHNTIYDTAGVDARFTWSTAWVQSNLIGGALRARDLAEITGMDNLEGITEAQWTAWFTDPASVEFGLRDGASFIDRGRVEPDFIRDFCGNDRDDGEPDLGAVEYDIDLVDPTVFCSPLRYSTPTDAATADARGTGATGDGGGCGCRTTGDPAAGLALVALAVLTSRRRR
jgi:MYXO-CTERM domain-containing protein